MSLPNTTRIVDLPDANGQNSQNGTTYSPINVHPNPYGNNSIVLPPIPPPQPTQGRTGDVIAISPEQQMMLQNMPVQKLPSRDIRIEPSEYIQDEEVKPNYIPKPKQIDYINEDEVIREREYKKTKHQTSLVDRVFNEIQTPLFVSILFFMFQIPIVNQLLYSKLSFLHIFKDDGTMNFYGLSLKSLLFGLIYYAYNYMLLNII